MNLPLVRVVYPMLSRDACRAAVQQVLNDYKVPVPVNSLEVGTVNLIAYNADAWNLHPAFLLATMSLEQPSVWDKCGEPLTDWQCKALCGVTDQNTPGGRPDLLGIGVQIPRAARAYAWSMGQVDEHTFGRTPGWYPPRPRFYSGISVKLLPPDPDGPPHVCDGPLEYALLSFCPHFQRLADFEKKFNEFLTYF